MMDFIMVPTIMAIITLGIYKLFELFVCKKERLMLIEKMGDKYVPDVACMPKLYGNFSFSAFKSSRLSPCSPAVLSTQRFKESMAKEISSSFLLI